MPNETICAIKNIIERKRRC